MGNNKKNSKNNQHVSKPIQREFTLLCIDGTDCHDSIAFSRLMKWAGNKRGFVVRNILSYLPPFEIEKGTEPRKSSKIISIPGSIGTTFDPANLPLKFVTRMLGYKLLGAKSGGDFILLPHGEVKGKENSYDDKILGFDPIQAAKNNSNLMQYFALAPGIINAGTSSAYLGFAETGSNNKSVDFIYLSGHGGMAGDVVGEDSRRGPAYLKFFRVQNLAREEFNKLSKDSSLVSPLWIILSSCFSLRKIHCQFWARYFQEQKIPIRGILGYQQTAPLSADTVAINEIFFWHLQQGKTLLESWKLAHNSPGLKKRWTALAFDFSKDDNLNALYQFKQDRKPCSKDNLFFYDINSFGMTAEKINKGEKIEILPPNVLLEIYHWEKDFLDNFYWKKFLITNIDFTKESTNKFISLDKINRFVNNESWDYCQGVKRMIDFSDDEWSFYPFFPKEIYQIRLFPPFNKYFNSGFKINDVIDFTLIHVRRDYPKLFHFTEIFDILSVNNQSPNSSNYSLVKGADNKKKNTIRIKAPVNDSFSPVKFAVRFKAKGDLLWFWFGIKIQRNGEEIFKADLDSFTVKYEHDSRFIAFDQIQSADPLPSSNLLR